MKEILMIKPYFMFSKGTRTKILCSSNDMRYNGREFCIFVGVNIIHFGLILIV